MEHTEEKATVADKRVLFSHLTNAVKEAMRLQTKKVYLSTRVLKHLYDRKPAEEFACIIDHVHLMVRYPDEIYENKQGKRGSFCLVKLINGKKYLCSIEIERYTLGVDKETQDEKTSIEEIGVATAFRIRDDAYLNGYRLLWSWRGGIPSS